MAVTYWLNLFSAETWNEFLRHGGTTTGFRESQKTRAEAVRVGDRFICYVTGLSRFIGILEATSGSSWETDPIWASATFPVRFKVKPIVTVPFENAIPPVELREQLKAFEGKPGVNNFGWLFQGSLRKWAKEDGDLILEELRREAQHPTHRPYDSKKIFKPTAYSTLTTAKTPKGEVTVPVSEEAAPSPPHSSAQTAEVTAHTEIQGLLVRLGGEMGLNVWVAKNDRNKEFKGKKLSDLPRVLKELPQQFSEAAQKTIELIDVLWLKKDAYVAAFEIESTTSIYSGLLRMADLISMQPNITIPLYIVAPTERQGKVIEEINRPTFASLAKPMSSMCRFISFSELRDSVAKHQGVLQYLQPDWVWEELAESCELEELG